MTWPEDGAPVVEAGKWGEDAPMTTYAEPYPLLLCRHCDGPLASVSEKHGRWVHVRTRQQECSAEARSLAEDGPPVEAVQVEQVREGSEVAQEEVPAGKVEPLPLGTQEGGGGVEEIHPQGDAAGGSVSSDSGAGGDEQDRGSLNQGAAETRREV